MDGFILGGGSSTRIWEYKAKLVLEEVRFIYRSVKAVSRGRATAGSNYRWQHRTI